MINLNLLPWREAFFKDRLKVFILCLGGGTVIMMGFMVMVHFLVHIKIREQHLLNSYLKQEITLSNKHIQTIKQQREKEEATRKHMNIIQMLQSNRSQVVHMFDELGSLLPDGVYFTGVKRVGKTLSIYGRAESTRQISDLMRKMETSAWLAHPMLKEIKKVSSKDSLLSENTGKHSENKFTLSMELMDKLHGV